MSKALQFENENGISMIPVYQYPGTVGENGVAPVLYMAPPAAPIESLVDDSQATENIRKENLIRHLSGWVASHLIFQMVIATYILLNGGLVPFLINALFFFIGFRALRTRRRCGLIAHFIYSLIMLFGTIALTVVTLFYCIQCPLILSAMGLIAITFMTVALRKQRILIQQLPRTPCGRVCQVQPVEDIEQQQPSKMFEQEGEHPSAPVFPVQVPLFLNVNGEQGQQGQQPYFYPLVMPNQFGAAAGAPVQPIILQAGTPQ